MKIEKTNDAPVKQRIDGEQNAPETDAPTALERLFRILSGVFFGLSVASLLVIVYVNTANDLTVPPLLSPFLFLAFGGGLGLGMLFRTFWKKDENVSSINFFFKIGFSVLVLLTVFIVFTFHLLTVLR